MNVKLKMVLKQDPNKSFINKGGEMATLPFSQKKAEP